MRRIVDMPKGGGIGRNGDIWFEILDDHGEKTEYRLASQNLAAFIAGLEHFSIEAEALKTEKKETPALAIRKVDCLPGSDGGLQLSIGLASSTSLRFEIPSDRIKSLLTQMILAIQARSSDT